jgi:hypothetical protein
METKRNAYRIFVEKPEENIQLRRPSRKWEDNYKMSLRGIGWCGMGLINLTKEKGQWRILVNTVMNF